jgi:hypothetical protein
MYKVESLETCGTVERWENPRTGTHQCDSQCHTRNVTRITGTAASASVVLPELELVGTFSGQVVVSQLSIVLIAIGRRVVAFLAFLASTAVVVLLLFLLHRTQILLLAAVKIARVVIISIIVESKEVV